jgi:nucleotide-binding universal stress UspA family protein
MVGGDAPWGGSTTLHARASGEEAGAPHRIAVCLDGSALGETTLPHALALARALGASLTLIRVLQAGLPTEAATDAYEWSMRREEARAYLDRLLAAHRRPGLAIDAELGQGEPAEQIRAWASHTPIDVTVICSHGSRGRTVWPLAGTARKLVERVPGSVFVIPAAAAAAPDAAPAAVPAAEPLRYRRVLVPLDGSPRAESVVPLAVRVARAHGAELILAHVVPVPELTRVGPLDAEDQELERRLTERNERVAAEYLDRLRGRLCEAGLAVRPLVLRGTGVPRGLAGLIERERADLVIASAHGGTGRTDTPYGHVAAELIRHGSAPILLVRERPRRALRRGDAARASEAPVRLPRQATTP